jgi:hypothetical protein
MDKGKEGGGGKGGGGEKSESGHRDSDQEKKKKKKRRVVGEVMLGLERENGGDEGEGVSGGSVGWRIRVKGESSQSKKRECFLMEERGVF